jgi:hypothetical protein
MEATSMKLGMRSFAILMLTGCVVSACGSADSTPDGSGGSSGSGGSGSGGSGSGGSASGGSASGGSASGGSASGGSASGGSASGGATGSGGSASGGATGSGGSASGGSSSGGAAGGGAGQGGSSNPTGGAGGRGAQGGRGGGQGGRGQAGGGPGGPGGAGGSSGSGGSPGNGGSSGVYNPCPTNGDPCRILPVGDSITFGINYEGSYRPELFHKALMAGQKITYTGTLMNGPAMVDNMPFPKRFEATSGITIDGISKQITNNKTLMMPADIVLIHIGTNDMYMTPAGAPDRLGKLIDQIIVGLPDALIAVAKIIPLGSSSSAVSTYNAAIPGVVQTRVAAGKHVIVVDLNTGFPAGGMDSVHPYQSGYNWMGDKWYDAIGSLFPK